MPGGDAPGLFGSLVGKEGQGSSGAANGAPWQPTEQAPGPGSLFASLTRGPDM